MDLLLEKNNTQPHIQQTTVKSNLFFYLRQTDQIQNIRRELCYHARFFTATDSTKSKQR